MSLGGATSRLAGGLGGPRIFCGSEATSRYVNTNGESAMLSSFIALTSQLSGLRIVRAPCARSSVRSIKVKRTLGSVAEAIVTS